MPKALSNEKVSKKLSFWLRHKPEDIGITLDEAGWTSVESLLKQANTHGHDISHVQLAEVVAECEKKRFTLSEDLSRIRAAQGHSVEVDLGLTKVDEPPPLLYHGTASRFLKSIFAEGIKPGQRKMVHLSEDWKTALDVGKRHGSPMIISLDIQAMLDAGFDFFQADNGVWLTNTIEPRFFKSIAGGIDGQTVIEKVDYPQPDFDYPD